MTAGFSSSAALSVKSGVSRSSACGRFAKMSVATRPPTAFLRFPSLKVPFNEGPDFAVLTRKQSRIEDAFWFLRRVGVSEEFMRRAETVTEILIDVEMDEDTISAGLLRGLRITEQDVLEEFGVNIADVWRRDEKFRSFLSSADSETPVSSLFSIFGDFPCLVIELAHAVAKIRHMPYPSQNTMKTREEMETVLRVHVPLADTLGLWALQSELEELAFSHLHPQAHQKMQELVGCRLQQYGPLLGCTIRDLEYMLSSLPQFRKIASFRVSGRIKKCFSIYQKMKRKQVKFEEVLDFVALRVILNPKNGISEADACAKVLREVKRRWEIVDGTTRDYITNPKDNGYQSLHTTILESGLPIEIQIRSERMHECSEIGSAAHHVYKVDTLSV